MPAIQAGKVAPDFTLPSVDGQQVSLKELLSRGSVLAAFFKISCPVCQFAFPYIERIYQASGKRNVSIIGISQNNQKDTAAFMKEFGITFPVLLDDHTSYPVSNAYGLTNVPSLFWIAQDGEIEISSVGWIRKEIEQINEKASAITGTRLKPVIEAGEIVPEFRAG